VSHLSGRSKLWRWSDVAAWAGLIDEEAHERARVIAAVNGALSFGAQTFLLMRGSRS
jgi:hypothetical protein